MVILSSDCFWSLDREPGEGRAIVGGWEVLGSWRSALRANLCAAHVNDIYVRSTSLEIGSSTFHVRSRTVVSCCDVDTKYALAHVKCYQRKTSSTRKATIHHLLFTPINTSLHHHTSLNHALPPSHTASRRPLGMATHLLPPTRRQSTTRQPSNSSPTPTTTPPKPAAPR